MKLKIALITFSFLFICTSVFAQNLMNGMVGYWPFNGNANDESGNKNNGIVNGASLCSDRFGNPDAAYSFNGKDNFIKVLNSNTLQSPKSEITMCAWVKVSNWFYTSKGWAPIISKSTKRSGGQYRALLNDANKFETSFDEYGYSPKSSNPWQLDSWYFIAIVIDNKSCKTYINGTLNSDYLFNDYMPGYNDASTDMYFGFDPLGDYEYLNGALDDIRIYNRALSDCEIFALGYSEINKVTVYDTIHVDQFQQNVTLQPNSTEGIDVTVTSYYPNKNYDTFGEIFCWTIDGENVTNRFYLDFDLSSIPKDAKINNAQLSLYDFGENTLCGGHSKLSGSNRCYIRKVTTPWSEQTITWNNQPSYTEYNQVEIPESNSLHQNYLDLDVSQLIKNDSTTDFGMVVMLENEEPYRAMMFATSDHEDSARRPKLVVSYTLPKIDTCRITVFDTIRTEVFDTIRFEVRDTLYEKVAVTDTLVIDAWFSGNEQIKALSTIKVFPNPTKKDLTVTIADFKKLIGYSIKIVDVNGKYIYATYIDKNDFLINLDLIANRGLYLLQIVDDKLNIVETKKIILE